MGKKYLEIVRIADVLSTDEFACPEWGRIVAAVNDWNARSATGPFVGPIRIPFVASVSFANVVEAEAKPSPYPGLPDSYPIPLDVPSRVPPEAGEVGENYVLDHGYVVDFSAPASGLDRWTCRQSDRACSTGRRYAPYATEGEVYAHLVGAGYAFREPCRSPWDFISEKIVDSDPEKWRVVAGNWRTGEIIADVDSKAEMRAAIDGARRVVGLRNDLEREIFRLGLPAPTDRDPGNARYALAVESGSAARLAGASVVANDYCAETEPWEHAGWTTGWGEEDERLGEKAA